MNTNLTIKITKTNNGLVSKEFAKNAKIFGTEEFNAWREFVKVFPNAKMVVDKKRTNEKLTYEKMQLYIDMEKSEYAKEFERVKILSKVQSSPYNYVLKWFKKYCSNYKESPIFVEEENDGNEVAA